MTKLPQIRPRDLVKFFQKEGFVVTRQRGSHMRLAHEDGRKMTIAIHTKPIATGTLSAILRQTQMSRENFLEKFF